MYTHNLLTTHLLHSTSEEGKLGIIFGKTNAIKLSLMGGNYSVIILALCHLNYCLLFIRSVISWWWQQQFWGHLQFVITECPVTTAALLIHFHCVSQHKPQPIPGPPASVIFCATEPANSFSQWCHAVWDGPHTGIPQSSTAYQPWTPRALTHP